MTPQSKKYERSYAAELMRIAWGDFSGARDLFAAKTKRAENIYLLAQQALEKGLKAVLCSNGHPVPFVHDIGIVVAMLQGAQVPPPFGFDLNDLTQYATIRRYLEGKEEYDEEEIVAVLSAVEEALNWCDLNISKEQ